MRLRAIIHREEGPVTNMYYYNVKIINESYSIRDEPCLYYEKDCKTVEEARNICNFYSIPENEITWIVDVLCGRGETWDIRCPYELMEEIASEKIDWSNFADSQYLSNSGQKYSVVLDDNKFSAVIF